MILDGEGVNSDVQRADWTVADAREEASSLSGCRVLDVGESEASGRRHVLRSEAAGPLARKARAAPRPVAVTACAALWSIRCDRPPSFMRSDGAVNDDV